MKRTRRTDTLVAASLLVACLVGAPLLAAPTHARAQAGGTQRFDADGLTFDYPAGWTLTDKSNAQAQHLVLTAAGTTAAVEVIVHRGLVSTGEELLAARDAFTVPLITSLSQRFGPGPASLSRTACERMGERLITGFLLEGRLDGEPGTAGVFMLVAAHRFVNLVYVRRNADEPRAAAAWKLLLDTLKAEGPGGTTDSGRELMAAVPGVVLAGRALKKPAPSYPKSAKKARTQGDVVVEVIVDEEGKVFAAKAVSGPPELYGVSETAARKARFTPTLLCGQRVKVTGIITYNFILAR